MQRQQAQQQCAHRPDQATRHVQHHRLLPQRNVGQHHLLVGELGIHEVHRVTPVLAEADGLAHQRRHLLDLLVGQRLGHDLALHLGRSVVDHHRGAQALDHTRGTTHHAHRLVDFIVHHRLAAATRSDRAAIGTRAHGERGRSTSHGRR